jgi:hypothetical protein
MNTRGNAQSMPRWDDVRLSCDMSSERHASSFALAHAQLE